MDCIYLDPWSPKRFTYCLTFSH